MRLGRFLSILFVIGVCSEMMAAAEKDNYHVTVLVSNQLGQAPVVDLKLVNAWGIAASPSSPWWVADNGSGWSTLYTGAGAKAALEVTVPGAPTGEVFYGGTQFELAPGRPARFMWASEDGTLSAWNPAFDPTHAHVVFTDPGSVYKGLAVHGNTLFTTDFTSCEVETIDDSFTEFDTAGGFEESSRRRRLRPSLPGSIGSSTRTSGLSAITARYPSSAVLHVCITSKSGSGLSSCSSPPIMRG